MLVEVVLGLSMSSHVTRLALVEGADGRGVTLEHDEFPVHNLGGVGSPGVSEHVVAVILGTLALAAAQDYRLLKVGITWSEEMDTEGWLVTDSLRGLGIRNVVSVAMIDALETFVHTLADTNDERTAAALVLESESATATSVSVGSDGTSQVISQVYRGRLPSDPSLRTLATSMFANLDSESTTVAVIGSGADEGWIAEQLGDLTPLSVIVPAECELALARGAAIRAAQTRVTDVPARGRAGSSPTTCSRNPTAHHAKSKPLLFVPRTARLATLDDAPKPEEQTPTPVETPRKSRGLATTPLLAAMLIMVSFTLLASLVTLTNDSSAHSAQSSSESPPPVALPSPSVPALVDPTEPPTAEHGSAQTTEMFANPGLKSFSPNMTPPASPASTPLAAPTWPTSRATTPSRSRGVPGALSPFVPFFNGMLAVLYGAVPSSPPPATTEQLLTAVPEPLMAAIPNTTQVPIPDLDLSVLANLSSPQ